MKQKNYPITVCGHKAAATVELVAWNVATISFKFPHRKGQKVVITHLEDGDIVWMDEYPTYTAIRFQISTCNFSSAKSAIHFCKTLIDTVNYAVNFDAKEELVTKELLAIFM